MIASISWPQSVLNFFRNRIITWSSLWLLPTLSVQLSQYNYPSPSFDAKSFLLYLTQRCQTYEEVENTTNMHRPKKFIFLLIPFRWYSQKKKKNEKNICCFSLYLCSFPSRFPLYIPHTDSFSKANLFFPSTTSYYSKLEMSLFSLSSFQLPTN